MTDILKTINSLRRPSLLVRAARIGLEDYSRDRDLKRVLKTARLPGPGRAAVPLLEEESQLEERRKDPGAGYSVARHVEVLIALMAEARLLRPAQP